MLDESEIKRLMEVKIVNESRTPWSKIDRAGNKARWAVRQGRLIKPDKCEDCHKSVTLTMHHEDYDKPLEVVWLCRKCHSKRHMDDIIRKYNEANP